MQPPTVIQPYVLQYEMAECADLQQADDRHRGQRRGLAALQHAHLIKVVTFSREYIRSVIVLSVHSSRRSQRVVKQRSSSQRSDSGVTIDSEVGYRRLFTIITNYYDQDYIF